MLHPAQVYGNDQRRLTGLVEQRLRRIRAERRGISLRQHQPEIVRQQGERARAEKKGRWLEEAPVDDRRNRGRQSAPRRPQTIGNIRAVSWLSYRPFSAPRQPLPPHDSGCRIGTIDEPARGPIAFFMIVVLIGIVARLRAQPSAAGKKG